MAARLTLIGPLSAGLILVLLGMAWFAHISPWFMWGIVADGDALTLFFDIPASLRPALADLDARYNLTSTLPLSLNTVRRLAWHRSGDSQTLAVVPTLGQGDTVKDQLTQAGWKMQRLGGLIIARQSSHGLPTATAALLAGARELWRHVAPDSLPFQPLALIRIPATPEFTPNGAHAYVMYSRKQFTGVIRTSNIWPKVNLAPGPPAERDLSAPLGLEFALSGHMLSATPLDILNRWQAELSTKIALTRSHPEIVQDLQDYEKIALLLEADSVAVGAGSLKKSFPETAEAWLRAEQGYHTPTTVAFRLPDGTLGYEKRPSQAPIAWQVSGDGLCRTTAVTDTTYWLCQKGENAVLGRNEDSARRVVHALEASSSWRFRVGPALAKTLLNLPITAAELTAMSHDHIILRVDTDTR